MGDKRTDPKETPSALANALMVVQRHGLWRQIPVMIGVLTASVLEGLSVASLFPILAIVSGDTPDEPNKVERIILGTLDFVGIDKSLGVLILVMIGLSVLKAIISLNVSRHVGYLVAEIATEMRTRMIDAMLKARWAYYTINPIGRFASAITNEANWGATIYRTSLNLLTSAIQVLVLAGIVFAVDWQVGLVGVGMAFVVGSAMRWLTRRSRQFSRSMLLTTRAIVTDLNDVVVGFKPMKAMHRHEILMDELRHETKSLRRSLRELVLLEQLANRLPDLLIIAMLVIVAYIGISLLQLDLASMLVSGFLIMGLTRSFAKMQKSVRESVSAEVGYYSFMDTLLETEAAAETFSGLRAPSLSDACRLENVTFSYGRSTVLEDVSIELKAGTITTLVGESGSGKTTTADLILGLFDANAGRVTLDGVPLAQIDLARWRSMVGYVPQEILLFNDTILMNVTLGDPGIGQQTVIDALERAGAMGFIRDLPHGLATTVGDRGVLLSGGQRQRIALARALVTKPALLILDEATSALDPETEAEICAAVAQERGRLTVLAITHQPAWIEIADRVYHIARGKVEELDGSQRQAAIERARPRAEQRPAVSQADSGAAMGAVVTFPSRIS